MDKNKIYIGNTCLVNSRQKVSGEFIEIQNEMFYKISNCNQMPDFLMTIISDSDQWMFISSNGSLTAGRKDRDNALFPYYTDDKIHDSCGITGSKSIILLEKDNRIFLWEPFSRDFSNLYNIERNLYKSEYGNKIIFEEINIDMRVGFHYSWCSSEMFGFVKKSTIYNLGDTALKVVVLDGIRNILPSGVHYSFQNEYSNLLDGYKKNELLEKTGLGLFMLSSIPVDRPEPSESLYVTTVWSDGLQNNKILISDRQLENFRKGLPVYTEKDVRASRGAYFVSAGLDLEQQQRQEWIIVAEINQSSSELANLNQFLRENDNLSELVNIDIQKGTSNLVRIVAGADGLQSSNEKLCSSRHFSNTLFNIMRGGTYLNNYIIDLYDFVEFVNLVNKKIGIEFKPELKALPGQILIQDLIEFAEGTDNSDFIRICYEYLPLTFSRRHGDPSRPWNLFSIENKKKDGTPKSDFQGNWRDIFQNWEALCLSYPEFIENIISKFVNASTFDGYNPYRIMRSGIEWESPDPEDPWAYIGYWGDHQIIYLLKLLEQSDNYHPGKLDQLLSKEIFTYANIPYYIKSYDDIVKDPKDTIEFDYELNNRINELVGKMGSDGRLLLQSNGEIYHVNLTEKILVTLLAKLSNFIPESGIWLNTQRPEWNDANNALVGNGASMVTLYYLRRFLKFWNNKFNDISGGTFNISEEVRALFNRVSKLFIENTSIPDKGFSDKERRYFIDTLGSAGSDYRNSIYKNSFSGKRQAITSAELVEFTKLALIFIDQSIKVNKRDDGLYHSYNLIYFHKTGVSIRHLYEMLEGQVAVLSSGYLTAEESLDVLDRLKWSSLFRRDQYSYLLYPDRDLPKFITKNNIPVNHVRGSELLTRLTADDEDSILSADNSGHYHFNGIFRNAAGLDNALDSLDKKKYGTLVKKDRAKVLNIFEELFDHQSFTGRSGTFYGYEGLGSIYWHMVSKLLLAVEECFFKAVDKGVDPAITGRIKDHYYEIKAGIGLYKSPELYGAFPTDAYSHTPGNAGAKQPGMSGQVKEDVISRMGELGVRIKHGEIFFDTKLINENEILKENKIFECILVDGGKQQLALKEGQLGYTLCQVPVIYTFTDHKNIIVSFKNGRRKEISGNRIDRQISSLIFNRDGEVKLIEVNINGNR